MGLKAIMTSLEGLEAPIAALYKKGEDGKFYLDAEGLVDKSKLDTFRENNITLQKQIDKLTEDMGKFAGIDPEQYKQAMLAIESDAEKKLLKEGKIDEVFTMRTEKMRQSYEQQLKAKDAAILKGSDETKKANSERDNYIVDAELRRSLDNPDLGFQSGVADLLKEQVLKEFVYKEGKVIRVKPDGSPVFGAKGEPATINEFLNDIVKDRPYLVKSSNGGGARNNGNGNQTGTKVMKRTDFDKITDPIKKHEVATGGYTFVD